MSEWIHIVECKYGATVDPCIKYLEHAFGAYNAKFKATTLRNICVEDSIYLEWITRGGFIPSNWKKP